MFSKICGCKSYQDKETELQLASVMLCFLKVKKKRKKSTQGNEAIEDKDWSEDEWIADAK